jgi:hypothetical protein
MSPCDTPSLTSPEPGLGLSDLQSTNGTFVDGRQLSAPVWLTSPSEFHIGETTVRLTADQLAVQPRLARSPVVTGPTPPAGMPTGSPARFDIGRQDAGVIDNIGRDKVTYIQQRESFLREVAATRTKAWWLMWSGFWLSVVGIGLASAGFFSLFQQGEAAIKATGPDPSMFLLGMAIGGGSAAAHRGDRAAHRCNRATTAHRP